MNPFGNIDEPLPPATYRPGLPQWLRVLLWYIRNPLHNFTHYMVGVRGVFEVQYLEGVDADHNGFRDGGGWLICVLHSDGRSFPYVSYLGSSAFYIGWHPARGKLGARWSRSE